MIMALICARVLAFLLVSCVAFAGGLILVGIGQKKEGVSLFVTCALVAWALLPNPDELAAFNDFQKQRLSRLNIEI